MKLLSLRSNLSTINGLNKVFYLIICFFEYIYILVGLFYSFKHKFYEKLLFISFLILNASFAFSQITVSFDNQFNVYYGATMNTVGGSGTCPSTPASSIYMDVPDNHSYSRLAANESGNTISNISHVSGITLKALTGGNGGTYIISFCSANPGSAIINEPGTYPFGTIIIGI